MAIVRRASRPPLAFAQLAFAAFALFAGAAYAIASRLLPDLGRDAPLEAIHAHGVVMVYLFAVPTLHALLANFVVPGALGLDDLPMPRLERAAVGLYVAGFLLVVVALATGGTVRGWLFHDAVRTAMAPDSVLWLAGGVALLVLSASLRALVVVIAVRERPASQRSHAVWGAYVQSYLLLAATPLCMLALAFLTFERTLGTGLVDPAVGGDALFFTHLVRGYAQPALASTVVAAVGVTFDLFARQSAEQAVATRGRLLRSLGVFGALGFGVQPYTSGMAEPSALFFGTAALAFHALLAVAAARAVAMLRRGAVFDAPLLYGLAALAMFAVAAPAGLFLALPGAGVYLGATSFVTGALHAAVAGGGLFALLGALHGAWPALTGAHPDELSARAWAGLCLGGALLAFVPMLAMGARGMPRPMQWGLAGMEPLQLACSLGCIALVFGLLGALFTLLFSLRARAVEHVTA